MDLGTSGMSPTDKTPCSRCGRVRGRCVEDPAHEDLDGYPCLPPPLGSSPRRAQVRQAAEASLAGARAALLREKGGVDW